MNEEMLSFLYPGSYEDEQDGIDEGNLEDVQDALNEADYEPLRMRDEERQELLYG